MADVIRLLLIDDHSLFREAIARLLAGQPDFRIAGECGTVDEGIRMLKNVAVDVVLLDINLGLQQGGAFPKLAREEGFTGKILVVTAGVSKLEATRLLQRGCSRIIFKHDPPERLIEAIREACKSTPDEPGAAAMITDLQRLNSVAPAEPTPLTVRERQVLRGVFGGLTNKEIAFNLGVSEPLVKSVIQQLFTKMGVRTRTQLVRLAVERYWKDLEEPEGTSSNDPPGGKS